MTIEQANYIYVYMQGLEETECKGIVTFITLQTLIEKDHLGDWSHEMDCCLWLTFQQPVTGSFCTGC